MFSTDKPRRPRRRPSRPEAAGDAGAPGVPVAADVPESQRLRLGEEIRSLRRARRMTLTELAALTGRSVGYLSQLERGRSEASVGVLQHIAQALGVQVGWFFPADASADPAERSVVVRKANRRRLNFASGITEYLL